MPPALRAAFRRLTQSSMFRTTAAMIGFRGASILVGIVMTVLLARLLEPAGFGAYFFTLTLANILALPILAGLPTLMVREIAVARGAGDEGTIIGIMRWSVAFVAVSTVLLCLIGGTVLYAGGWIESIRPVYLLALPLIVGLGAMHLAAAVLKGYENPLRGSLPDGLIRPSLLLIFAVVVAAAGSLTPERTVLLHFAAACLAAGWALVVARTIRRTPKNSLTSARPLYRTRAWLAELLPLSLITGAALLNNRLDVMMLGWLADISEVGRYGIALQIAALATIGPNIVHSIVQPQIARFHAQRDLDTLQHETTKAARLGFGLALAAMAVLALFGDTVVLGLVGEDFKIAIPTFLILGSARVLFSAMGPVGIALNMTGNARMTASLTMASALLNAVLNALLIPPYGAIGAAWATGFSLICLHVAMAWQVRQVIGIDATVLGWRPNRR